MSDKNSQWPEVKWALDLFEPDPTYQENFISKNFQWIVWPSSFAGAIAYTNWFQGRPYMSGLPRYGMAIASGIVVAKVMKDAKFHREAERDMVLRQYIKLHPEDFPEPPKTTFNDVFEDWVPLR